MKILKENATREEAIVHAAMHLGEKVVKDGVGFSCWFTDAGALRMGNSPNAFALADPDGYTLYDPTHEPEPEDPTTVNRDEAREREAFEAGFLCCRHAADNWFHVDRNKAFEKWKSRANSEPEPEPDPAEIPRDVLRQMHDAAATKGFVDAMRVYHRWAAKRGAA